MLVGFRLCWGVGAGWCVLFENCIVDASIYIFIDLQFLMVFVSIFACQHVCVLRVLHCGVYIRVLPGGPRCGVLVGRGVFVGVVVSV